MQREFSKELEQDRDFEFGGEVFTWMYPYWEESAKIFDENLKPVEGSKNGDEGKEEDATEPVFSFHADTQFAIERVPIFLDPKNDSHKRWKALVKRKSNPVPRHQIVEVYRWLVQVSSGRPFVQPQDLPPSAGATEPSSEVASP